MKQKMRFLILAFALIGMCVNMTAQEIRQVNVPQNETKEERKAREKRLEELRDSIAYLEAKMAIDSGYFVITADRMSLGNRGINIMSPESNTNFVLVQGDRAVVQLAFNNGFSGLNGLGGITVEGTVTNKKKSVSKKGDINYDFSVTGTGISAQINIVVYKNSNEARAFINPNFHSQDMTVYGPLIPYDMRNGNVGNRIFKGSTLP